MAFEDIKRQLTTMTIQEVEEIFITEFQAVFDRFTIIEEDVLSLASSNKDYIYHPGVYVFFLNGKVIKVGRHLTNSRKRALEHIRDNTRNEGFEMGDLNRNIGVKILLFNLKDANDYHWAASVEMYLETKLDPVIKSKRLG
ncbi:hypothetical protein [Muricauda sp. MAR_2010_75]|uniref:hypothetical protein n=2 Tax=Flavobacteriaceae TaxID=49546 RepID=UPI0012E00CAB|nr:hypothetical protein [Muricauda sp. MAR_2010_75]